jgi:1,4-alpha-glucan branching enzyme
MDSNSREIRQGMGAIPHKNGTLFRVWAPHASSVFVAGTFNEWSETRHPLVHEAKGYWSVDVSGAKPNDEYRYLVRNGDLALWRIDPYSRAVTNSAGNSIVRKQATRTEKERFRPPPWNEMVIYEMHVGTFTQGRRGEDGDLDDVKRRMEHLVDLGINAIEVMPVTEFAGDRSWGYNPCCPFSIESDYGGPDAFCSLVKAAHANGIAVIVDVVYNHFGPSDLILWQFDGWSENGNGGIYFYNDWRSKTPWGATRPDYGREEVRQYIRDNALSWFEEYDVDGLRWDATAFIRNVEGRNNDPGNDIPEGWSLMQWVNEEVHQRFPGRICIAEDLRNNPALTGDAQSGGAAFDAQWSAAFVHPIREAIIGGDDHARSMGAVRDAICHHYNPDAFERIIYTESHDEVASGKSRIPEEIHAGKADSWESKKRSALGAILVMTSPGIPMLFQGQELLEDRWFHDDDPVDWKRKESFSGMVRLYGDLIGLRRNADGLSGGLRSQNVHVDHVNDEAKIIAFQRWDRGGPRDDVLVVLNMAIHAQHDYRIGFSREGTWKVRFNSDWRGYDPTFGDVGDSEVAAERSPYDGLPASGVLSIGPYSGIILSQDA